MTIPVKDLHEYAAAWSIEHDKKFSFEAIHSRIRRDQALRYLLNSSPRTILEIGCGLDPLYPYLADFDEYIIVEPIEKFASIALQNKKGSSQVRVINDYFERCYDKFRNTRVDYIVLNGVLHEVPDPRLLLESIHNVCNANCSIPK